MTVAIFAILFYWFAIRPAQIKKECSQIALQTFSQERKDEAQNYLTKNCLNVGSQLAQCSIEQVIINAPLEGQNKTRSASDFWYARCLRANGF